MIQILQFNTINYPEKLIKILKYTPMEHRRSCIITTPGGVSGKFGYGTNFINFFWQP